MKTTRLTTLRNQSGFALAELLIACAVVGVVLAGTFVALQGGQNAYQYGSGPGEVQQKARTAGDRMAHDLRPGSVGTARSPTRVAFQDIHDPGSTVTVPELL